MPQTALVDRMPMHVHIEYPSDPELDQRGGFGLSPGKLLTLKYNFILPQTAREPSTEIPVGKTYLKYPWWI